MSRQIRRGRLALILVYLLRITSLYGLEYNFKTFNVQPHPVQFLREPDDHFTLPGVDVTFVCSVAAFNGFSNISWFFNNTIIKAGPHYSIINSDSQSTSTLTVKNVSTEDQGNYHCCIDDWKAKIRSRPGQLHVMNGGNMSSYDDRNPSNFIININALAKSTVTLSCYLELKTEPVWQRNELILDSKVFNHTMFIDEAGNLVLVNVSKDHSGHYQCQVNQSGTIRIGSSYVLTVNNSVGRLDHDTGTPSSQYLLIIPNNCDKSPHNQTVTLQCPVTSDPSPVISWYLNGDLVNLTDYNITDNVGNNTWIIQGGDPCRLIGYWQCFEAGTVHSETRVLPYGWINPTGRPTLRVANLSEDLNNDEISVHVNISWSPPQYLAGLDTSDIYYQLHATDYDNINTTDTHSVLYYDELNLNTYKKALDVTIAVHYNGSTANTLYIPSNVIEKKRYNNLLCHAVDFKPPHILQYFENDSCYAEWKLSSYQELSVAYLRDSLQGWLLSGNCTINDNLVRGSVMMDQTFADDHMTLSGISEGASCVYEVQPKYLDCGCGASCRSSFTCAHLNVSPTSMIIVPAVTNTVAKESLELSHTPANPFTVTTVMMSIPNHLTSAAVSMNTMITLQSTSISSFTNPFTATTSTIALDTMITLQSTSTSFITVTPFLESSNGNISSSSITLFVTIGVLISLLIGSVIVFCTVLCLYRWKSTGKYADIRFLKMSQAFKMMKSPLSNNYCSTINIANESVCEMPVSKVMKWIDKSDFKQNGRSDSFQSVATSQMFAYIRKDCNSKQNPSDLLADYIDDVQLEKQFESAADCSNTCNGANKNSDSLLSLCLDKGHLNPEAPSTSGAFNPYYDEDAAFNKVSPYCDELGNVNPYCDENVFNDANPYCDENNVFNNSNLNHSQTSLPDYIDERNCSGDVKTSHKSISSISLDSLTLSQHCPRQIPDTLCILKDNHASSLPVLTPHVFNPIFAKSFEYLQSPCIETATDNITARGLKPNLASKHDQEQSTSTENNVNAWLSIGSSLDADHNCESNPDYFEELQTSGYKSLSGESENMNSKNTTHTSMSDLSLCSNQSDASVNALTSGIQTSSGLGYFELPSDKIDCTYFSRTGSKNNSLSELELDFDTNTDSQLCDITTTTNTNKYCTMNTSN